MFIVVWEFRIRPDAEDRFLDSYGPAGCWVRLFRRAPGFLSTELTRSVHRPNVFYTLDSWDSEASYNGFREAFRQQYEELDRSLESLSEQERLVGILRNPAGAD